METNQEKWKLVDRHGNQVHPQIFYSSSAALAFVEGQENQLYQKEGFPYKNMFWNARPVPVDAVLRWHPVANRYMWFWIDDAGHDHWEC